MAELGKMNRLRVMRRAKQGLYLDGQNLGDILLPNSQVPEDAQIGGEIEVFVYCDSDDRPIGTRRTPRAQAGEFACLMVQNVVEGLGTFLAWGLTKDLLLPLREQESRPRAGDWLVVYVMLDERSGRLMATERGVQRHLNLTPASYREGEKVSVLVIGRNELGYQTIVENAHRGLLYHTDLRVDLFLGQKLDAWVRRVREDGKIDLGADPAGISRVAPLAERILEELRQRGGRIPYGDHSNPQDIRTVFGASKKSFKQAVGLLYKERRIIMLERGIALPEEPTQTGSRLNS